MEKYGICWQYDIIINNSSEVGGDFWNGLISIVKKIIYSLTIMAVFGKKKKKKKKENTQMIYKFQRVTAG